MFLNNFMAFSLFHNTLSPAYLMSTWVYSHSLEQSIKNHTLKNSDYPLWSSLQTSVLLNSRSALKYWMNCYCVGRMQTTPSSVSSWVLQSFHVQKDTVFNAAFHLQTLSSLSTASSKMSPEPQGEGISCKHPFRNARAIDTYSLRFGQLWIKKY